MNNINSWLEKISTIHHTKIDLGLDRIKKVAESLNLLEFQCPVIMITGTNGKGSSVVTLEQIYLSAGFKVASYISPYLLKVNEQIRINGNDVDDETLCHSFDVIDCGREDITLTEFEFITLAALHIFQKQSPDVVILEVGMGGRQDAVNIVDADVAVITNVDIDHVSWLGETRENENYLYILYR